MANIQNPNFEKFDALISQWAEAYRGIVCSYVAIKSSGKPVLLFGRVLLDTGLSPIPSSASTFETQHIIAGRISAEMNSETFLEVISRAKRGAILGQSGEVSLTAATSSELSIFFAPIFHPSITDMTLPRLPSLLIHGISKSNILNGEIDWQQLDWQLKGSDSPFENMDELLSHFGLPNLRQISDSTTLEVVAQSPGHLTGSSIISNKMASVECRFAKTIDRKKIKLGFKIIDKNTTDRGTLDGSVAKWRDDSDALVGTFSIPVADAPLVQAFLSYSNSPIHQWWVFDPEKLLNPRYTIHQNFDPEQKRLSNMLIDPDVDKPNVFEGAVSMLLTLLGFSTSNYGRIPKLQDGPDIIALTPSGHVAVVECTIGLLDKNDKLGKLVQRTESIRRKLIDARFAHLKVQPVIITCLTRNEVAAHMTIAGEHGIAVVCKENILRLLQQTMLPLNTEKHFEYLNSLIPKSDKDLVLQLQN